MRIKMIKLAASPDATYQVGGIYVVDDALGKQFIDAGAAIELTEKPAVQKKHGGVEAAAIIQPEKAIQKPARRRKTVKK